jgi:hypothetical protein
MENERARAEWDRARDTLDLAAVATRLLGPGPGRRGERGKKLWWHCPIHQDDNPSFCVTPGKPCWRCFGCGESGDAMALVRRLNPSMSFPEAVAYLTGGPATTGATPTTRPRPAAKPPAVAPAEPSGMAEADALTLVEAAAARLWTPEGADALTYLHGRGLTDETIRAARLGMVPPLALPGRPRGIVVPWFDGDRPTLFKLRQPEGVKPKYREVFRDRHRLTGIYPDRRAIRPGRPLVITEGEFDALLLGQELSDLAAVVTLGSASARPDPAILGNMLAASPWYIATDADAAGDKSADGWPTVARRVRPPGPFKDWTEARHGGVDLRRWWSDRLGGTEAPPLFSWDELAGWRWGPSADDPTPGIIIDRPSRGRPDAPARPGAIQTQATC